MKVIIISLYFISTLIVLTAILKGGRPFKSIFNSIFQGIASLAAVNLAGLFTGVTICVNYITVATSCIFGTPGCIAILLLDTLFR